MNILSHTCLVKSRTSSTLAAHCGCERRASRRFSASEPTCSPDDTCSSRCTIGITFSHTNILRERKRCCKLIIPVFIVKKGGGIFFFVSSFEMVSNVQVRGRYYLDNCSSYYKCHTSDSDRDNFKRPTIPPPPG